MKSVSILLIFSFFLAACNLSSSPKEHLVEIYCIALDSIMEQDEALSDGMKFIAIDMSNFDDLKKEEKEEILTYFNEKYQLDVMDATLDELKEKGFYDPDAAALEGVLLRIEEVNFTFHNNVFFKASMYRSGKGAVGVEITVHYKDGRWQIKKLKQTWIS